MTIGASAPRVRENLGRQLVYSLGRVFTYTTLGVMAGFGGMRLAHLRISAVNVPALLALVAGGLLVFQGLLSAGVIKSNRLTSSSAPCLTASFFSSYLTAPGLVNVFLAGRFTGLLPCGLLYGMLALAASTQNVAWAAAVMVLFGLGTVPMLVLTGCGASLLSLSLRHRLFRATAWCVVFKGLLTMARGLGFLRGSGMPFEHACPLCG